MKSSLCIVSLVALWLTMANAQLFFKYPFQDPSLPWDKRLDDLVGRLTLEEIMNQTMSRRFHRPTSEIPRLGMKPHTWIAECARGESRTNATAFPHSIGLAASFSTDVMFNMSEAISYEVRAHYNGYKRQGLYNVSDNGLTCMSPVINIMRHPLWGRNQETYGEDPYLSGRMAQSHVRGLQGNHPRYVRTSAGCKHFDVHGGPEDIPASRFSFNSKVSMRDWRMTFLPQFKMCVEAGTYSLMCSYNSINGIPACINKQLLTDIARTEWGFTGYIVSDAEAISRVVTAHKYLHNVVDTAAAAIKAGCNLELTSSYFSTQLEALKQGKLTEADIRNNVRPLLYTRLRLGEFDPDSMNPYSTIDNQYIQSRGHRELAVITAMKTFVLLKNDNGFLPLKKKLTRIAVVGPFANTTDQLFGDYTSNILPQFTTTVYQGLSGLAGSAVLASGCSKPACSDYDPASVRSAVSASDLVVVCLGLGQDLETEGKDRADLDLPGSQLQVLKDAVYYAGGAPVLLLLFNAGPLDVTWAALTPGVTAIMACFYPAQASGEALRRALTAGQAGQEGQEGPGGRLPATWPANLNQVPSITDYHMAGHTYRYYEGDPLYPFGYGLSYSTFRYQSLSVSPGVAHAGQEVKVKVTVENTGKYTADEVVQVYMSWGNTSVPGLPRLQLVGFSRETVTVGNQRIFVFVITAEQIRVWVDDNKGWGYLTGEMTVFVGGQQPNQKTRAPSNVLQAKFTVI